MRIIGLSSFYDESPKMLAAMLSSGSKLPVDHWVILDGAYAIYPEAQASSQIEQHEMIARTCNALGVGWTIHVPQTPWFGNEVEKRDQLFAYGQLAAKPGDWFVVMDADQTFRQSPPDLRDQLEQSVNDAAIVEFWNYAEPDNAQMKQFHWEPISKEPIPIFFKAQVDPIRVIGNHYTYETADHRRLWGHGLDKDRVLDFTDLTEVQIAHRQHDRTKARLKDKLDYYERREVTGIEFATCLNCTAKGTHKSHAEIRVDENGYISCWAIMACDEHFEEIEAKKQAEMAELGIPGDYFAKNAPIGAAA